MVQDYAKLRRAAPSGSRTSTSTPTGTTPSTINKDTLKHGTRADNVKVNNSYTTPRLQEPSSKTRDDVRAETRATHDQTPATGALVKDQ